MKILKFEHNRVKIAITGDELATLCNCMTNAYYGISPSHGISISDAPVRIGAEEPRFRKMRDQLSSLISSPANFQADNRGKKITWSQDRHVPDQQKIMTMNIHKIGEDEFSITVRREELLIFCRCIKEARDKIDDWEFPILNGGSTANADEMLSLFREAARNLLAGNP